MAKILTDKEMAKIISDTVVHQNSMDGDSYVHFLEDVAKLITTHFGGETRGVIDYTEELGYNCAFRINELVPEDGGVFMDYDTDVTWKDGKEID